MDCFVASLLAMTARYESAIPRRIAPSRVEDGKGGHTVFAIPPYATLLGRNRYQLEHPTVSGCLGNIAAAQLHTVELARFVGGQIGRPNGIVFDQIDGDLVGILAFVDELFAL